MKHIKHYLITTAISLCCFVANAHDFEVDGIYYNITSATDRTVMVTFKGDYSSNYGNEYIGVVTIPSTVTYRSKTYRVTSIGEDAFWYCSSLTSVTIPENSQLTSIGDDAFEYCSSLTAIDIPDGVTSIGIWAFHNCSGLTSIDIPESVTSIGSSAFNGCSSLTSINIPDGLTSIGYSAFYGCTSLTSIDIPESVTSIDDHAFYGCSSLTSIDIPEDVTSIGSGAFYGCSSLTTITVAERNTVYDSRGGCNALIETASNTLIIGCATTIIPESVTSIGSSAFYGCTSLTSIDIPKSVTSIGTWAFCDCSSLTSIVCKAVATAIGSSYTFYGVDKSIPVYVPAASVSAYQNADYWSEFTNILPISNGFEVDGIYYDIISEEAKTVMVTFKGNNYSSYSDEYSGVVVIPSSIVYNSTTYRVASVGYYAFYGCNSLTSITIPDGVTNIWGRAFYNCSSLTSIDIPESVTSIGDYAFYGCSSLTSIDIPKSVTSIGNRAFDGCNSLTSIDIPEDVTSIGSCAFYGCSSLTYIVCRATTPPVCESYSTFDNVNKSIPVHVPAASVSAYQSADYWSEFTNMLPISNGFEVDGIYYDIISEEAKTVMVTFKGDSYSSYSDEYSGVVVIPSYIVYNSITYRVTSVGDYAFYGCNNLTSITIPDGVADIGDYAFANCLSLTSINIPRSVTGIGEGAFDECSSLTSITIPEGVTSIDAFYNCRNLVSVTIPKSVTNIGYYAFSNCSSLTSITLPEGVKNIGYYAFYGCSNLTSITCKSTIPPVCESFYTFYNVDKSIPVYVPAASVSAYQNADYWSAFTNIQSDCIGYGECGDNLVWTLTRGGELIIEGTGAMNDYYQAPWSDYCESIKKVTIKDGVTSIGIWAFHNCSGLTSINIPDGLTSIGDRAFYGCTSLTSIDIPESVTSIEYGAFRDCSSLTSIDIPESVTSIGNCAFYGCSSLTSISIPENSQLTSIGNYAFYGCSSLTSITIPEGVTSLDRWAFDCSSLTSIVVAEGNTVYDSRDNCNAIIETRTNTLILGCGATIIPNTVLKIGDSAFSGCSSLTSITIPEGVTTIGDEAIAHCDNLTSVYIPKSVTEMGEAAFTDSGSLTSIVIDEGNAVYDSRDNCNAIIETSTNTLIQGFPTTVIPNTVRIIGHHAFENYTNLPSIVIPEGVTTIEDGAFEESNLTSIAIPSSVIEIKGWALHGTPWYENQPDGAIYCGKVLYAYKGTMAANTSFEIKEGTTSIGAGAFDGCSNLTSITIPESVMSIGEAAFYECI